MKSNSSSNHSLRLEMVCGTSLSMKWPMMSLSPLKNLNRYQARCLTMNPSKSLTICSLSSLLCQLSPNQRRLRLICLVSRATVLSLTTSAVPAYLRFPNRRHKLSRLQNQRKSNKLCLPQNQNRPRSRQNHPNLNLYNNSSLLRWPTTKRLTVIRTISSTMMMTVEMTTTLSAEELYPPACLTDQSK